MYEFALALIAFHLVPHTPVLEVTSFSVWYLFYRLFLTMPLNSLSAANCLLYRLAVSSSRDISGDINLFLLDIGVVVKSFLFHSFLLLILPLFFCQSSEIHLCSPLNSGTELSSPLFPWGCVPLFLAIPHPCLCLFKWWSLKVSVYEVEHHMGWNAAVLCSFAARFCFFSAKVCRIKGKTASSFLSHCYFLSYYLNFLKFFIF